MKFREVMSKNEKELLKAKTKWGASKLETVLKSTDIQIDSIYDFLSNIPKDVVEEIDKNQVEVCPDCGKIYKTTFEYRGKVPRCTKCGKVLSSIPKDQVSNFKKWKKIS